MEEDEEYYRDMAYLQAQKELEYQWEWEEHMARKPAIITVKKLIEDEDRIISREMEANC